MSPPNLDVSCHALHSWLINSFAANPFLGPQEKRSYKTPKGSVLFLLQQSPKATTNMFVPLAVGQALAFAAKVSTAMVIPQIVYFTSIHFPREALQISFFSSLSNCISVICDLRSWLPDHAQRDRKLWSVRTTFIIVMSLLLWLTMLVSDLLVFQFAQTRVEWRAYPATQLDLNFKPSSSSRLSSTQHQIPAALINPTAQFNAFQNRTYIPGNEYQYLAHVPQPIFSKDNKSPFVQDMSPGVARISIDQEQQCVGGQMLDSADHGEVGASISCPVDSIAAVPLVFGFNKKSLVRGLQTVEGAYFQFTTSKQRDVQYYKEPDMGLARTKALLTAIGESYALVALATDQQMSAEMNAKVALDYLGGWKDITSHRRVEFLYYTLESDRLFDRVPRHTYNYLLVGVSITPLGSVTFSTMSYTVRNIFAPGSEINPLYLTGALGIKTADIVTDVSEEHAMLTLLQDPKTPLQIKSVTTIDARPAIIVTILSIGISLVFYSMSTIHRIFQRSSLPFNPYLEGFHKALESPRHDSLDGLMSKIQDADLVMVNGCETGFGKRRIGLIPSSEEKSYI